jgi:hypothetical protein|tara:strand:- start:40 stop:342 length:303 start_codon:yes stop_codon:yes gene_type:complete
MYKKSSSESPKASSTLSTCEDGHARPGFGASGEGEVAWRIILARAIAADLARVETRSRAIVVKNGEEHREQLGQIELEVAAERDGDSVEKLDAVSLQLLA